MGGRPLWGNCLESRTFSNKHSSLIIKKDASWGSLLRLHRGRELIVVPPERNFFREKTGLVSDWASLSRRCKQRETEEERTSEDGNN